MTKRSNRTSKRSSIVESANRQRVGGKLEKRNALGHDLDKTRAGEGAEETTIDSKDSAIRIPETTLPSQARAAPERQIFGATGEGIVWAIIDSGIDGRHPHFRQHQNLQSEAPLLHRDFTSSDLDDSSSELEALIDANGHGTHAAGVIAGELKASEGLSLRAELKPYQSGTASIATFPDISGVAPRCKLVSLKVLDDHGNGSVSSVIAAIFHIQEVNGYGRFLRIHGVHLGLAYTYEQDQFACGQSPLCVEVNRLVASGVVVVTCAGNTGFGVQQTVARGAVSGPFGMSINDPGNAEQAITVGSTHGKLPHTYGVSYFSSKGPTADGRQKPDLVAPGERVLSCVPGSKLAQHSPSESGRFAQYGESTGTTSAAAHVSGAIAALLSVRRDLIGDPTRVKQLLIATAEDLKRDPYMQGHGLINLMRALTEGTSAKPLGVTDRTTDAQEPRPQPVAEALRVSPPSPVVAPTIPETKMSGKRFSVALSFPGEKRDYVKKVVAELRQLKIPRDNIFYDRFYTAELTVPNLDTYLQEIYDKDSELIVIFISAEYEKKEWCGLEWRAIRDIIKQRRDEDIMPLRFDDTHVPGLFSVDGYVDLRDRDPETVADLIMERLAHNRKDSSKV
jgi:serine protease AprX